MLFPRLGSPTLPHTRAETRPLDLKLSWAPRAAMPVSAFLPPNFGNTVLSHSDPHQRRRWRFSHTLSSRKMLSRGPGWVRPTPPGEGGNPKEHPQPVPLRVSAPDRVFPSPEPWALEVQVEARGGGGPGDGIKAAKETGGREEGKESKEGRERGTEPGSQSERTPRLEPRQIALEGYLWKCWCSARGCSSYNGEKGDIRASKRKGSAVNPLVLFGKITVGCSAVINEERGRGGRW